MLIPNYTISVCRLASKQFYNHEKSKQWTKFSMGNGVCCFLFKFISCIILRRVIKMVSIAVCDDKKIGSNIVSDIKNVYNKTVSEWMRGKDHGSVLQLRKSSNR